MAHRPGEIWLEATRSTTTWSSSTRTAITLGNAIIPIPGWAEGTAEIVLYLAFAGDRLAFATNHAVYFFDVVTPESR